MKFYKRFPGDINIKTGHLDPAEFGCYDRLLDHYYATEAPIPEDGAYSICRAVKPEHRRACDKVLAQFFMLREGGWVQPRADEEIAQALPRIEAARTNGKKGGRPPIAKPSGFTEKTQAEPNGKTSQIPESSSPTSKKTPRAKPAGPHCPDGVAEQVWSDWLELRAKKRAPVTQTVVDGLHSEAGKAGMSVEAFLRIWCQRGTQGLQADWLKPHERQGAPPAETPYARQMRERAQVLGPGVAAKPPGQPSNIIVLESDGNDQQKRIA